MAIKLHARRSGAGQAVLLLHGLFGSGGNLGALARSLHDEYDVCTVDLPNHGRSGWLQTPDIPSMAQSLLQWMDDYSLPAVHLVGHSLGGKVAMQLALQCPGRVLSLVVADIAPVAYSGRHDEVFAALEAVAAGRCSSRDAAATLMARHLQEEGVVQFLLMSLQRDKSGVFRWRMDVHGLRSAYARLLAAPAAGQTYDGPVLFIKGGESNYLLAQHWPEITALFPAADIKIMPGCGHWLHVQKPQLFNAIVARFLKAH